MRIISMKSTKDLELKLEHLRDTEIIIKVLNFF